MPAKLELSPAVEAELQARFRSRTLPAEDVRRADILLRLAAGHGLRAVARQMRCSVNTVRLWQERFRAEGLAGLYGRHKGREVQDQSPELEARILDQTRRSPQDGSTHWSTRKLAAELGINHMRVARTWAKTGLKPHPVSYTHLTLPTILRV